MSIHTCRDCGTPIHVFEAQSYGLCHRHRWQHYRKKGIDVRPYRAFVSKEEVDG